MTRAGYPCNGPMGSYRNHHWRHESLSDEVKDGGKHVGLYREEQMRCKNCGAGRVDMRLVGCDVGGLSADLSRVRRLPTRKKLPGVILALLLALPAQAESRRFWPVSTGALATTSHTHVEVRGVVTYRAREDDGDIHLRVCDGGLCIVAECIPELPTPCAGVRKGDAVAVRGISRFDRKHGWGEVHPVLGLRKEH